MSLYCRDPSEEAPKDQVIHPKGQSDAVDCLELGRVDCNPISSNIAQLHIVDPRASERLRLRETFSALTAHIAEWNSILDLVMAGVKTADLIVLTSLAVALGFPLAFLELGRRTPVLFIWDEGNKDRLFGFLPLPHFALAHEDVAQDKMLEITQALLTAPVHLQRDSQAEPGQHQGL